MGGPLLFASKNELTFPLSRFPLGRRNHIKITLAEEEKSCRHFRFRRTKFSDKKLTGV